MPNLTEAIFTELEVNRILELGEDSTLSVKKGSGSWSDIPDGWFFEQVDQRPSGGKKFYRLSVADIEGTRSQILATMDTAKVNLREYKVTDKDAPIGETREWIIELLPL